MPLRFLLDEHVRGVLWRAIERHNAKGGWPIDVICVGDFDDLPLGSRDPEIIDWAERDDRIIISFDRRTLATHLESHLRARSHSPGICILRDGFGIPIIINYLELASHAGRPDDYRDQVVFIP